MSASDAQEVTQLLRVWFGFLRGAWTGPLFLEGIQGTETVWKQFVTGSLREDRHVATWLPEMNRIDSTVAFENFVDLWSSATSRDALVLAVSWLIEANTPRTAPESKVVLSQVALELLAWVHVIETQQIHSRKDFKSLSAAGKIRVLLDHISVPTAVPEYMPDLRPLCTGDAFDGPGVLTSVRNNLVHATEKSRSATLTLSAPQLFACSQLALQYVELAVLAICDYGGSYARRGWKGWKGEDEVVVPWNDMG
jgi:hypothetical protein